MRGVKTISRRLGYGQAPMPAHDPHAPEGICPLCGAYGPLTRLGWCSDRACKARARDLIRQQAAESPDGVVPGMYYRIGNTELINLEPLEKHSEPVPPVKHPDQCTAEGCTVWALPQDTLCPTHRLEANAQHYAARQRARSGKPRRQKGRDRRLTNHIRGWEKLGK